VTPALKLLDKSGIAHEVLTYAHDPQTNSYGTEAAEVLGVDPTTVYKTLLANVTGGPGGNVETVVGVVPVSHQLDLKALAKAAHAKRASMAEPANAERLTGYVIGGISPLGQRKRLRTFVDASSKYLEYFHVSGGQRGLEIRLAPSDLVNLLGATFASITVVQ